MTKILLFGAAGIGVAVAMAQPDKYKAAPKPAPTEAECRADVVCFAARYTDAAAKWCQKPIERLAKYDFEWTDGVLSPRFSRAAWKDRKKGTITFTGGELKMQNGFGAVSPVIYQCDFDPKGEMVLGVRVAPGKL